MFDIGFFEMVLVGIIALLVLGPERLPKAARTVGLYVGKMRRTWLGLRNELMREVDANDLRRELEKTKQELEALQQPSLERVQELAEITRDFKQSIVSPSESNESTVTDSKPAEALTQPKKEVPDAGRTD